MARNMTFRPREATDLHGVVQLFDDLIEYEDTHWEIPLILIEVAAIVFLLGSLGWLGYLTLTGE